MLSHVGYEYISFIIFMGLAQTWVIGGMMAMFNEYSDWPTTGVLSYIRLLDWASRSHK